MNFPKNFLGRTPRSMRESLFADLARMELVDLAALRLESAQLAVEVHRASPDEKGALLLEQAILLAEIARRTGEAVVLARAAHSAERATRCAQDARHKIRASYQLAAIGALTGELYGDPLATEAAEQRLAQLEIHADLSDEDRAMILGLKGRLEARRALAESDLNRAVTAAGFYDDAVIAADACVRSGRLGRTNAAALRLDRADLLVAFGGQLKDDQLLLQAKSDMAALAAGLDKDRLPISWMRAETLGGAALVHLGDLSGDALQIQAGVEKLSAASQHLPEGHSPLDVAGADRALGLALASLGDVSDNDHSFDVAISVLENASHAYEAAPQVVERGLLAYDRAATILRRAERVGDLANLANAELLFREELAVLDARRDETSWAVLQFALGRVYRARHLAAPSPDLKAHALMALTEALDIFAAKGFRSLADAALGGLEELRAL